MSANDVIFTIGIGILAVIVAVIWGFVCKDFFRGVKMPFSKVFNKQVRIWMWFFLGVTAYFTLGHLYASWLVYANAHPASLASKILGPWPMGLTRSPRDSGEWVFLHIEGPFIFLATWTLAIVANIGYFLFWFMFGGGIAELLHLTPRP